jgi:hypothetical protein
LFLAIARRLLPSLSLLFAFPNLLESDGLWIRRYNPCSQIVSIGW